MKRLVVAERRLPEFLRRSPSGTAAAQVVQREPVTCPSGTAEQPFPPGAQWFSEYTEASALE